MQSYTEIQNIEGLQIIPINEKKIPLVEKWEQTKTKHDLSKCYGIGLVCGQISGNIEAIDIDLKYDLTKKLFSEFKKTVNEIDADLLKKLVVQKTMSGGYHLVYRCEKNDGNLKLANRFTIETERQVTYEKTYKYQIEVKKSTQEEAVKVATKARDNDKIRVLFETRGEKGYIAICPTPGYELKYGCFENIQTITPEERQILFSVAYSFNEVLKEFKQPAAIQKKQIKGLKPSEDYNDRGDVVSLLCEYGWTIVGKKGAKILLRRPGDTKAAHSGNYDEEKKWFSVFSTSTEFEAQTPYQPYAVYCLLKCKGDFTLVPKMLYDEGFGDRVNELKDNNITIPSQIDLSENDLSFLATEADYDDYLHKWRTGTFEMGLSTGIPVLDKHFLFKEGDLVIINGLDNVGKSSLVWYLSMLASVFHGWPWLIFSSENRIGGIVRKLIEFYWSETIESMSEEKYKIAKKFVKNNFDIIKCSDKMYNYQDILNMTKLAFSKKKYKGLMIDPYNSLKVDIPSKSKNSTYDYHYEAASVIQLFCKQYNISIYLNCHVGTPGARNKDKSGYTKAPQKEDTEMGVMFANKADEFLTIHRVTQHETEWMFTEFHVRKVKETETGGKVTFFANPIDLKMVNNLSGFETVPNRSVPYGGFNPIKEFHTRQSINIDATIEPNKSVFKIEPNMDYEFTPAERDKAF